ncbi:MAG: DUF523 and DUF1722 domain-containing protein [Kiritimatiellae bacterium]|nr:DUF523 and DUF1722 domain-containing protein [Kiritimatiellia bacterium]
MGRLRMGISACLLGQRVRYDGQHKRDAFLTDTLGTFVDYVPVCPEVECGLPVPREAMRLVGDVNNPRLMTQRTKVDLTEKMQNWAHCRIRELRKENLSGFIFKSRSPSSGMERVKVYSETGGLSGKGSGLFAAAFMKAFPLLPVEDEGRLNDPRLRENFIERVFAMSRYRDATASSRSIHALTEFHATHKYLLMAHSVAKLRTMGQLLAVRITQSELSRVRNEYETLLLNVLNLLPTTKKHTNVLMHMMGYLKTYLSADEKQELLNMIEQYRQELIPLIVPITLLKHYVRKYQAPYLLDQVYLDPHPAELKLRNHA